MESWNNMKSELDAYMQWIEYSRLANVREMTSYCTHIAEWLEPTANERTRVTLKQIGDDRSGKLLLFYV